MGPPTRIMVSAKKTRKAQESINSRLQLVIKSGKYSLGYKSTLKCLRAGTAKLVIISTNCPALRKSEIEYYSMLSKCSVHHYTGTNNDLGTACGKYFRVSCLSILDAGKPHPFSTSTGIRLRVRPAESATVGREDRVGGREDSVAAENRGVLEHLRILGEQYWRGWCSAQLRSEGRSALKNPWGAVCCHADSVPL